MKLINQFSLLILLIFPVAAFLLAFFWRQRPTARRMAVVVGVVLVAAIGFVALQPSPAKATPAQVEAWLDAPTGQPLFLEFYSHY